MANPFINWTPADVDRFNGLTSERKASLKSAMNNVKGDFIVRQSTDEKKLNKLERAYLSHLRKLNVPALGIQSVTLKLADDCRLTPDFNYIDENGAMVFVDVKGFQREDALLKMKFAARTYTWARFIIVTREKGQWNAKEVKP